MRDDLFAGPPVELDAVLAARDARVALRHEVFAAERRPVVSLSPVMPGPVKDCAAARLVQSEALAALDRLFEAEGWRARIVRSAFEATGPEALIVVEAEAETLKRATVAIEESHPLGRLFDIDVIDPDAGAISRGGLGLPTRRCFVCGEAAHACARSRAHPLDRLLAVLETTIDAYRTRPSA